MRVDAVTAAGAITRIEIEIQPAGIIQSLSDVVDGVFSTSLAVPAGLQTFTGRAYAGTSPDEFVVGEGATSVEVEAGATVEVVLRILDTTGGALPVDHGPIITTFVASNTSPLAGEVISLSATAVDPDAGQTPTFAWTQNDGCPGTFGSPSSSATTWSASGPAQCTLTLTVSSGGLTDTAAFVIAVRSNAGTVNVTGYYVPHPVVTWIGLWNPSNAKNGCGFPTDVANASCQQLWWPGQQVSGLFNADFGIPVFSSHTSFQIVDDCGGAGVVYWSDPTSTPAMARFTWTAPATPGVCLIRAEAANEGLVGAFTLGAVVVPSPACADDPFEDDSSIAMATEIALFTAAPSRTATLVPNDEDWIFVSTDGIRYSTLTASADAALPVEIWCGTSTADAALAVSGTGGASVGGLAGTTVCWVRVLPDPAAAGCGAAYTLTITESPPP